MQADNGAALPWSEACERNKDPILKVLREYFPASGDVLEIGSGTGQHVEYFSTVLPSDLTWQPADTGDYLPGLRARIAHADHPNVLAAADLDVRMSPWPVSNFDAVFSANTLHFMSAACVAHFFRGVGEVLNSGGVLVVYGPFKYNGQFTSESNARFEQWLKAGDPDRGVKDFELVNEFALEQGLKLQADVAMPANNQALVWQRP